ncbi:V-set and immunoglobulin domain-containing protein 8-like [Rhineura floridana]|uniref:V-set and immunoglobulin domain-containing protein 8-like n=1 Tax=Rhineura floridana TaxID=261503 RepID=UPI002AC819BF|nr:V-set and immunoglobulin domain-containing protein 8-like [Rhineura floridana]
MRHLPVMSSSPLDATEGMMYLRGLLTAVKINAKGREAIYLAKGESIKLGCPFELEPQDHGPNSLDIEWTQMNSDPTNLDSVILSYHDRQVINPGYHYLQQRGERVTFAIPDPSQYDASINLQDVQISDSATYECKVKKSTVATRKVTITVLERPSLPQCSVVGKVAMGHEVVLRCASNIGTSPLMYRWAKVADRPIGNWLPPTTAKDASRVSLIVGAVLGSLLFLLLLLCLIVGLIYCCRKRRCKEEASQIRVDTAPPRARGGSRNGSLRSVLDYMPHNIGFLQRCKYAPPKEQEGMEMLSPSQDADPVGASSVGSEAPSGGCTSAVTTKARVHYASSAPSARQTTSPQAPICQNTGGSSSSAADHNTGKGRRAHPGQYGGVPVMVPAKSREGLLV